MTFAVWCEFWILTLNLVYPDTHGVDWDMQLSHGALLFASPSEAAEYLEHVSKCKGDTLVANV